MAIADALLPEYDHEIATTRRLLERVPDGKFDWKPHQKSMSLGQLASHVATLASWGSMTLNAPEFDMRGDFQAPPLTTRADLLASFDKKTESGYGGFGRSERQRGPVDRGPRIDDRQRSSLEIRDDEIDIPPFLR